MTFFILGCLHMGLLILTTWTIKADSLFPAFNVINYFIISLFFLNLEFNKHASATIFNIFKLKMKRILLNNNYLMTDFIIKFNIKSKIYNLITFNFSNNNNFNLNPKGN
jgi:hypothetical protein